MRIIELILDEEDLDAGVEAISIVESPAIESDFVALKNQEIKLAEVDKEKKILMGALLIPDKPIYRNGSEGEYYIFFSKDTIVKASQMFLQNGNQSRSTLEHAQALNGLTLVESWIVEDKAKDKTALYGLDVPVGTWMGSVKVNNEDVWNEYVKTNKVKGFSIEGYFADKMEAPKEAIEEQMAALAELKLLEATWIEKARIAAYYENQIAGVKDKNADEDEKLAKLRTQQTLGDAKNTFNQIAQLAGEDSKVGKAMADSKRNYKRCTRCYECIYNCTKITNHIRFPSISYNTSKFSWFSSSKKYCSN